MEGGYTSAEFHPDGLILGAGTEDSTIRVWEMRQQKVTALWLAARLSESIPSLGFCVKK